MLEEECLGSDIVIASKNEICSPSKAAFTQGFQLTSGRIDLNESRFNPPREVDSNLDWKSMQVEILV